MSDLIQKYLSRKLVKSYAVLIMSYVALMTGKLSGSEWIVVAGLTLGIYSYFNNKDKSVSQP
jgi:hypothetical protein